MQLARTKYVTEGDEGPTPVDFNNKTSDIETEYLQGPILADINKVNEKT